MKTLDDAWNAGPKSPLWENFSKRHSENVAVYWPGQSEPTRARYNHDLEAVEFFKTFPHNHLLNNPYKISSGQADYTLTVADFSGTLKGPMKGADGKMIPATNKEIPHRILHSCELERGRRDIGGEALLRSSGLDETDWADLSEAAQNDW
jgi:hypothetical protein